jgi:hypothetical protein
MGGKRASGSGSRQGGSRIEKADIEFPDVYIS